MISHSNNYERLAHIQALAEYQNSSYFFKNTRIIDELVSAKAQGRYAGSKGAQYAADKIIEKLQSLGLSSLHEGFPNLFGFKHKFTATDFTRLEHDSYLEFSLGVEVKRLNLFCQNRESRPLGLGNINNIQGSKNESGLVILPNIKGLFNVIRKEKSQSVFRNLVENKWIVVDADQLLNIVLQHDPIRPITLLALSEFAPRGIILCGKDNLGQERSKFILQVMNAGSNRDELPPLVYLPKDFIQNQDPFFKKLLDLSSVKSAFAVSSQVKIGDFKIANMQIDCENVIAKIPADPGIKKKLSPVIIGAHFDHIGRSNKAWPLRGSIAVDEVELLEKDHGRFYRGFNDNVSGVAVVLEVAEKLNDLSKQLKFPCDVIFTFWNAEELDLQGSRVFLEELREFNSRTGEQSKITPYHYFNFDMVANAAKGLVIKTTNLERCRSISRHIKELGLPLNKIMKYQTRLFDGTDSDTFSDYGVPSVLFTSSVPPTYHTLADVKSDEKVFDLVVCSDIATQVIGDCIFRISVTDQGRKSANRQKFKLSQIKVEQEQDYCSNLSLDLESLRIE